MRPPSAAVIVSISLLGCLSCLRAQNQAISAIQDRELLEVMIEDSTSELARNEASLAEARSVYNGLGNNTARDQELRVKVQEHIVYYEDVISSQRDYLAELRAQMSKLERRELTMLRNLQNFGSPYRDNRRTAFFDSILRPRNSNERFGESGKTRMEDLDTELFAAIGGLQGRLNQENTKSTGGERDPSRPRSQREHHRRNATSQSGLLRRTVCPLRQDESNL